MATRNMEFSGTCPQCDHTYYANQSDIIVCDCFEKCPLCGQKMEPYTPDLCANDYAKDGKRELLIIRVCNNIAAHSDHFPYFSTQQPTQVELEALT